MERTPQGRAAGWRFILIVSVLFWTCLCAGGYFLEWWAKSQ